MAAPKGNQYAKGCTTNGRPRTYDYKEEAKHLDEWSQRPDTIELIEFCIERDFWSGNLSLWAKIDEDFCKSLKKAKDRIAVKRSKLVSCEGMNYGVYMRYQGMYDSMLHSHEREEKIFESNLKKESNDTPSKVVFEVNYATADNKVEILPKTISKESTPSA